MPPRNSPQRRQLCRTIAAYLLFGALSNIFIALTTGLQDSASLRDAHAPSYSLSASPPAHDGRPALLCREYRWAGRTRTVISPITPGADAGVLANSQISPPPAHALRIWRRIQPHSLTIYSAGWPMRTVSGWEFARSHDGAIHNPPKSRGMLPKLRADAPPPRAQLLTIPLWPGAIINTLFYAALLFIASLALQAAARALFTNIPPVPDPAHTCPHCAYDLRGITSPRCPECGWRRTQTSLNNSPQRAGASPPRSST